MKIVLADLKEILKEGTTSKAKKGFHDFKFVFSGKDINPKFY
jgi:hypothetical protein